MLTLKAEVIHPGNVKGKAYCFREDVIDENVSTLNKDQIVVLKEALSEANRQLEEQVKVTSELFKEKISTIYETHRLMTQDPMILSTAYELIASGLSAYEAYKEATRKVIERFQQLDNEYMNARVIDIIDATDRVLYLIRKVPYDLSFHFDEPRIVVAEELRPSWLYQCEHRGVLGFIVRRGAYHQHGAVIARIKGIPLMIVSDLVCENILPGDEVTMDSDHQRVLVTTEK